MKELPVWARATLGIIVALFLALAPFFLRPSGIYLLSYWAVVSIAALGLNTSPGTLACGTAGAMLTSR